MLLFDLTYLSHPLFPPSLPLFPNTTHPAFLRFNIYILDYCKKRGYHKTATQLVTEADIPPESKPPINAQQGLLFESASSLFLPSPLSLTSFLPSNSLFAGGGVSSGSSFKPKTVAPVLRMQSSTPRSAYFALFLSPPHLIYIHPLSRNSIKPRANFKRNELVKFLPPLVLSRRRVILSQMACPAPPLHYQAAR